MKFGLAILVWLLLAASAKAQMLSSKPGPSAQTGFVVSGQVLHNLPPLLVTAKIGGATQITTILTVNKSPSLTVAAPAIGVSPATIGLPGNSLVLTNVTLNGSHNVMSTLTNQAAPSLTSSSSLGLFQAGTLALGTPPLVVVTSFGASKKISGQLGAGLSNSLIGTASLNTGSTVFTSRLGIVNGAHAENSMLGLMQPGIQ